MDEIERKFLVNKLPDLTNIIPIKYERYVLPDENGLKRRIQRKDNEFELEEYQVDDAFKRSKKKIRITKDEFLQLKNKAVGVIVRDGYLLETNPPVSIKIYHGTYNGLIRAEIEFKNQHELQQFQPFEWMGKEITNTPIGLDNELVKLSKEEFKQLLNEL